MKPKPKNRSFVFSLIAFCALLSFDAFSEIRIPADLDLSSSQKMYFFIQRSEADAAENKWEEAAKDLGGFYSALLSKNLHERTKSFVQNRQSALEWLRGEGEKEAQPYIAYVFSISNDDLMLKSKGSEVDNRLKLIEHMARSRSKEKSSDPHWYMLEGMAQFYLSHSGRDAFQKFLELDGDEELKQLAQSFITRINALDPAL